MTYGETDLSTAERNAWQAGSYELAEALALAMDAEERATEVEQADSEWEEKYSKCQEAWDTHNAAMRVRLENLAQLVDQAARVSGRELILERIGELESLIDEAEGE